MSLGDDRPTGVRALRAVAHPVRLQMLSLLTGAELSASDVARELGITQANASYHLRLLLRSGHVVVTGVERIRGGVAKKYRHPWDQPIPAEQEATTADRQGYVRALAEAIPRRYAQRRATGPQLFTDADLWVSSEVWDRARALLEQASRLVHAEALRPRTAGSLRVNVSVSAFAIERAETCAGSDA